MLHTSLSPCFHGNTDEGSCILLHLSSSQRLSLERKSTGQEDSNRRKADDELGGMAVEKEGCSGRDDPVPQPVKRPCVAVFVLLSLVTLAGYQSTEALL